MSSSLITSALLTDTPRAAGVALSQASPAEGHSGPLHSEPQEELSQL